VKNWIVIIVIIMGVWFWKERPYATKLPVGTMDLSTVQSKLNRLSDADRKLVEGYVQRSRGQIMNVLGDPLLQFSATTFGEAIEAQKHYLEILANAKQQSEDGAKKRALRFEPIRKFVNIKLLKHDVINVDGKDEKVAVYRITSKTDKRIKNIQVQINIRKQGDFLMHIGTVGHCNISQLYRELGAFEIAEIACVVGDQEYLAMPENEWDVIIEPYYIEFSDGKVIELERF